MEHSALLSKLLLALPEIKENHHRHGEVYALLNEITQESVESIFGETGPQHCVFDGFGKVHIPYLSMGSINSTHLFGLDELIIFAFYLKNIMRYKIVYDIGANIGLHSIMLAKAGYSVTSYEPDPWHFEILNKNLALNDSKKNVQTMNKAVSTQSGELEFVRVLGNTTGSHLAGAKKDPYGDLERFKVGVDEFRGIVRKADLIKMDVEGHEAEILLGTNKKDWAKADAIVEIGTLENAEKIFNHLKNIGVNIFSQKKSWEKVDKLEDLPTSHKEGSIFISQKLNMPW